MNKYMSLITVFILIPICTFTMYDGNSPASSAFTRHDAPKIVELAQDYFQFKKPTPGAPELSMTTLTFHTFPDDSFLCGAIYPKSEAAKLIETASVCLKLAKAEAMNFAWVGDKIDFSTVEGKLQPTKIKKNHLWSIATKVIQRGNNVEFRIESVSAEIPQSQIAEMQKIAQSDEQPADKKRLIFACADKILKRERRAKKRNA